MGYSNCVVPGCSSVKDSAILFKYWTTKPFLSEQWKKYLPNITPKAHYTAVCEKHFDECMFSDVKQDGRKALKLTAVPSKPYTSSPLIMQGTIHQGDSSLFPLFFGVQCCAASITACCYSSVHDPDLWTPEDIDACIHIGTQLHIKSKRTSHRYLLPHEVHNQVKTPNGNILSVYANKEAKFVGPIHHVENFGDDFEHALTDFFNNCRYGILT